MKRSRFFSKSLGVFLSAALCFSTVAATGFAASAASDNLIANSGFESATTTGWVGRGGVETLTATTATAHSGNYSMLVTGRTQSWNGPSYDFTSLARRGSTYNVTAYVKAVGGQSSSHNEKATLSLQETDSSGTTYTNLDYQRNISENSWTELSGQFTLSYTGTLSELQAYVESPDDTLDYYVDDVVVTEVGSSSGGGSDPSTDTGSDSLWQRYADYFDIGVAVSPSQLRDSHESIISKHFNSLTAENCMKIEVLEPQEGVFDFSQADAICDYAIAHNMKVRGHNLVWHSQVPSWFFTNPNNPSQPATRDQLLARMKRHITTVLNHFKEKYGSRNPIYCWDVCNEVISDSHQNNGLRGDGENSRWLSIIGPDYIAKAFQYAHEADPSVKLYINDYNIEDNNQKTTDMYNLVKSLLADNVPIDGIGIQMHISNSYPSMSDIRASIEKLGSLGLSLQITELDCGTDGSTGSAALEKQAQRMKELFQVFIDERRYINSVTVWGVSDELSWRGTNNAATLFDSSLNPKPAFYAIYNLVSGGSSGGSTTKNSTISPTTATFDLNTEKQKDISVAVNLNGNTLNGIYNGSTKLTAGTDYTVASDGTVTILKSYLGRLSVGTTILTFDFSAGTDPVLTISVTKTSDDTGGGSGGTPTTGNLEVQMYNGNTSAAINGIMPRFKLINKGTTAIDLSKITLRYYFTEDGTQNQNFWCDWSSAGTPYVTGKFVKLASSVAGADTYLEIGFTSGAGSLAPGASVEVQARFSKSDWTNYNQADDYSFNPNANYYVDWSKVTAYQNGNLIWGVEP